MFKLLKLNMFGRAFDCSSHKTNIEWSSVQIRLFGTGVNSVMVTRIPSKDALGGRY